MFPACRRIGIWAMSKGVDNDSAGPMVANRRRPRLRLQLNSVSASESSSRRCGSTLLVPLSVHVWDEIRSVFSPVHCAIEVPNLLRGR